MNEDFKEAFEKTKVAGTIASGALDEVNKIIKPVFPQTKLIKFIMNLSTTTKHTQHHYSTGISKSCCTSTNHVVCHGLPSEKILKEGDIVNVDVTVTKKVVGTQTGMFKIGEVSIKAEKLINTTYGIQ